MSSACIYCIIVCFSNINYYTQHDINLLHGAESFGKPNSHLSSHKRLNVLSKSKVHHHMTLSIPGPHSEPVESSPRFQTVIKIRFNFILPSTSRPSKWSISFRLLEFCVLYLFKHLCYLILVGLFSVRTLKKEWKLKKKRKCAFTIFYFFLFLSS